MATISLSTKVEYGYANVSVKKALIERCDCCFSEVGDKVNEVTKKYYEQYMEMHPDTSRSEYDIRSDVKGVPGYEISCNDNSWSNMRICESCHDAMIKASKAISTSGLESASVRRDTTKPRMVSIVEKSEPVGDDTF